MLMVAFTAVEKHTLHKGGIYMDIKYTPNLTNWVGHSFNHHITLIVSLM